jgi:hypothetical protein
MYEIEQGDKLEIETQHRTQTVEVVEFTDSGNVKIEVNGSETCILTIHGNNVFVDRKGELHNVVDMSFVDENNSTDFETNFESAKNLRN